MLWKDIKNYEGYYQISDMGLVRSLDRYVPDKKLGRKFLKGKVMKLTESVGKGRNIGYLVVNLRAYGKSMVIPVHRLVAEAFIPNPNNLPTVNHKDGDKHNNSVENLEWASYTDNNIHALQNKLRNPRSNMIKQLSIDGDNVKNYISVSEAARMTQISRGMISHCLNGRTKIAGGYRWEYVEKCNDYLTNESTVDDELPLEAQERLITEDIVCTNGNI